MLTPQSTLPDAAQQVGTGTGGKTGRPWTLAPSLEQQPQANAALIITRWTRIHKKSISSCLTWRHRSIWPSWPRSCSRCSGETPSSESRGPTAKESTSCREGWKQSKASCQARAKEATENVAWGGDQPVERGRRKRKTGPWGEVMGKGALRLGAWAGQHSWEKQPSGQQRNRWSR